MTEAGAAVTSDLSVVLIDIALLSMMAVTALAIARLRSLFAIVMLSGVYSLFSATWFVIVDAVDVSFTEAAVGAGISTAVLLGAMLLTSRTAKEEKPLKRIAPILVCLATGGILVYATIDLPGFGDADSPANTYLAQEYLTRNMQDIGIPNVVTSILASYRGFDTFGETGVVFIAGVAVALLLGFGERSLAASVSARLGKMAPEMMEKVTGTDHHVILRVTAKFLIPIILLYAFYVQFHGDYSPGGGFQAGVIFAVGIILFALIFGVVEALLKIPAGFSRYLALVGFVLYGSVGLIAMVNGGNFLDYDFLVSEGPEGHHGQHYGIIGVELGVLFAVAGSMLTIFYAFAGRAPEISDEDW